MAEHAWIDAHNHLQDARLRDAGLVMATMRGAGVQAAVANATSEADWPAVEQLAGGHDGRVWPAYGIHPWKADTVADGWPGRLRERLAADPRASVGEVGLDQWVSTPSLDVQVPVFEVQVEIAREMERPVTIHCLKAWGPLFEVFDRCPPPRRFLMHSFNGSIEVARRLIPLGAYFSFSGYFLHERKASVVEVFRQLPLDRILVETDAPDMAPPEPEHVLAGGVNHPANLPAIGRALAKRLGMSGDALAAITAENTRRCFGIQS